MEMDEEDMDGEQEYDIDDEELAEQDITNVDVGSPLKGNRGLLKKIRKRRSIVE